MRAQAKIRPPVIKAIVVDVVNQLTALGAEDHPVHLLIGSVDARLGVGRARRPEDTPRISLHERQIGIVHERDEAGANFDLCDFGPRKTKGRFPEYSGSGHGRDPGRGRVVGGYCSATGYSCPQGRYNRIRGSATAYSKHQKITMAHVHKTPQYQPRHHSLTIPASEAGLQPRSVPSWAVRQL